MHLTVDDHVIRQALGEKQAFCVLKKAGFDGTDFSFHELKRDDPLFFEDYAEKAKQVKNAMDEAGLVCPQCHAPCFFDIREPMDASSASWIAVERSIRAASLFGAKVITLHSLYIPWVSREEEWALNLKFYKSFEPVLMETGLRIGVENLPIQVTDTPEDINRFLVELDSPCYGAILDTGHSRISGIEPDEFVRRLNEGSLIGVHIQDQHEKKDEHIIPYMGETDWESFIKALKCSGYSGPMSLEIIHFMEHVPQELLPAAYEYAASVGRHLIGMYENESGNG